jgi:hypothetical protein
LVASAIAERRKCWRRPGSGSGGGGACVRAVSLGLLLLAGAGKGGRGLLEVASRDSTRLGVIFFSCLGWLLLLAYMETGPGRLGKRMTGGTRQWVGGHSLLLLISGGLVRWEWVM